ncbi:MAG: HlyC/CorC family transporter [Pseudomonadota bacterium]
MSETLAALAPALGAIVVLLMVSAFFSGSETALTATSRARMHKLASDGDKRARRVNLLIGDRESLIGSILLGNNLVNNLMVFLVNIALLPVFGEAGGLAGTVLVTILVFVFAEVLPKTAAIARPDNFAMTVAPVMRWIVLALTPLTITVQFIVGGLLRLFSMDLKNNKSPFSAADELRGAIDLHHVEGELQKEVRDLFRGALDLDDIKVEEIMIHRKSIEMLDLAEPAETLIPLALKSAHTRLPLYRDTPDDIVGILHAKDLLRALWDKENDPAEIDLEAISRTPYFVPETTTLQEQLDAFKVKQEHFGLVVDEYGSIRGLVTLEDILEEIVGEIEDEHDSPVQGVRPQADGTVNVDGDVTIRDLNRALDWSLPDEEAVTIAGLVIHETQSIPEVGQTFAFHGLRFKILRRRRNQITGVKIMPLAGAAKLAVTAAERSKSPNGKSAAAAEDGDLNGA